MNLVEIPSIGYQESQRDSHSSSRKEELIRDEGAAYLFRKSRNTQEGFIFQFQEFLREVESVLSYETLSPYILQKFSKSAANVDVSLFTPFLSNLSKSSFNEGMPLSKNTGGANDAMISRNLIPGMGPNILFTNYRKYHNAMANEQTLSCIEVISSEDEKKITNSNGYDSAYFVLNQLGNDLTDREHKCRDRGEKEESASCRQSREEIYHVLTWALRYERRREGDIYTT